MKDQLRPAIQRVSLQHVSRVVESLPSLSLHALSEEPLPALPQDVVAELPSLPTDGYRPFKELGQQDMVLPPTNAASDFYGTLPPLLEQSVAGETQGRLIGNQERVQTINEHLDRLAQAAQMAHFLVLNGDKQQTLRQLLRQHPITNSWVTLEVHIAQDQTIRAVRLIGGSGSDEIDRWLVNQFRQFIADHGFIGLPPLSTFDQREIFQLYIK